MSNSPDLFEGSSAVPSVEPATSAIFDRLGLLFGALLAASAVIAAVVAVTSLPFTEGWYEALIFFGKHGLRAYRDMEFVLPPMTPLYFRTLDAITGSAFVGNKLLGLLVALANAALIYFWMRSRVVSGAAVFAAFATFAVITTVPIYIAGDYHDLVHFFVTLSLIALLTRAIYEPRAGGLGSWIALALGGTAVQLLLLTKQNIGLGVFAAYCLLLVALAIIDLFKKRLAAASQTALQLLVFLAAFVVTGVVFLWMYGLGSDMVGFYRSLFLVESKGTALYVATRLAHDPSNLVVIWPAFLIAAAILLYTLSFRFVGNEVIARKVTATTLFGSWLPRIYLTIVKWVLIILVPVVVFFVAIFFVASQPLEMLWNSIPCIFVLACLMLDIAFGFLPGEHPAPAPGDSAVASVTKRHYARILLFGAVLFANTMSAGLNVFMLIVLFGYYLAIAADRGLRSAARQRAGWLRLIVTACSLVVVVFWAKTEVGKFQVPFSWWGMLEPPAFASSKATDLPYLEGLRLDPDRVRILTRVVSEIQSNTQVEDPILSYPDIPIFYMLANRLPMTRSYVQWFDFATFDSLFSDFNRVSDHPPKVVIEMSVPQTTYQGHESLIGRALPQRSFAQYLQCMIENGAFKEIDSFFYNRSDALEGTFNLRTDRALSAEQVNTIAALTRNLNSAHFVVSGGMGLGEGSSEMSEIQRLPDQRSAIFGGILVKGKGEEMPALVRYLSKETHIRFTPNFDNYILRVLKRANGYETSGAPCRTDLQADLLKLKAAF